MKDFLFRSDSNWRFGDSIRNYLATLSSKKSQLASKKLQFGYGEMIHWFITRRREDQDLKKPVVNKLNRRRRSPMPAFRKSLLLSWKISILQFPLKMPPTVSVNVIKVKHGGRPFWRNFVKSSFKTFQTWKKGLFGEQSSERGQKLREINYREFGTNLTNIPWNQFTMQSTIKK